MGTDQELLDTDELMQLALEATNRSQNGEAIQYVKRLLALKPDHAEALYLLGAQQAQIGMPERAIVSMGQALALRPGLDAARFQLGMLLATSGRIQEAEKTWQPLDALAPAHPFYLFKEGFLHLVRDEFEPCIDCFERGIAGNGINEALNDDMRRLLRRVVDAAAAHKDKARGSSTDEPIPAAGDDVPLMFLDAYKQGKVH